MFDYIYLSLRRLSDLAGQLPPPTRGKIEATIKGTIPGILEASLKAERAANDPRVFDLLSKVEEALQREGKIGSVGESTDWFASTVEMYWGPSEATQGDTSVPVVFFGGTQGSQAVLLGGSLKHLRARADATAPSTSDLPDILGALAAIESSERGIDNTPALGADQHRAHDAISYCLGNWGGTRQRVNFLAKRLATWSDVESQGKRWRVTIGAPLYVRA